MATIQDLYEAFSQLHLRESLPIIITETGPQIVELVQEQLQQGNLATGEKISPQYVDDEYAKLKNEMNASPGYGIPDAKYTGALYDEMKAEASGDTYDIESSVDYAKSKNILQYGPQLLAMSEDSKQTYCDETLGPAIQQYITEKTGLLFE
jgi:hypothetical protein